MIYVLLCSGSILELKGLNPSCPNNEINPELASYKINIVLCFYKSSQKKKCIVLSCLVCLEDILILNCHHKGLHALVSVICSVRPALVCS